MLRAIIFDFDGVIVDSETGHLRAFQRILTEEGVHLSDRAYYERYLGLDDKNCFRAVLNDHGHPVKDGRIEDLVNRKARYYSACLDDIPLLRGVSAFVRRAAERYVLAIGSGALRREIDHALRRYDLSACFSVVVSAGDVAHSKPAPDCYQTVLRRLQERGLDGLRSAECVVLEDARHGIVAAKAAGMRCVAVTTSYAPEALGAADRIVSGLDSLTLSMLEELVMQEEDKGKRNNP